MAIIIEIPSAIITIDVKYRNATAADKVALTTQLEYCARMLAGMGDDDEESGDASLVPATPETWPRGMS